MINNEFTIRLITAFISLPICFFIITYSQKVFIFSIFLLFIIASYEWFKMNIKTDNFFLKIIGFIFLSISFISSYYLRGNDSNTILIFLWLLLISVFTDVGGYLFGKIFGGKRLTKISPNKTYSGSLGSFVFSFFLLIILTNINIYDSLIEINFKYILITIFLSFVSQIGDLIVSFFKRINKVKNTGNLLPGHGGLLDRIDGIIFVMPVAYFLIFFKIL